MLENIFNRLKYLASKDKILKNSLLNILKEFSKTISVFDQMNVSILVRKELKDIQGAYKEGFLEIYVKYFILRIKDIKENTKDYKNDIIDKNSFIESIKLLEKQKDLKEEENKNERKLRLIYIVISLYTTFILDEPIHPVGSPFPGGLTVEFKNGTYYCPVKENNKDNPKAVCQFCIAKQTPKF